MKCDECGKTLTGYAAVLELTDLTMAKRLLLCDECTDLLVKWLNANRVVRQP